MHLEEEARKHIVAQAKRRGDIFSLHLYAPRIGEAQATSALTRLVVVTKETAPPDAGAAFGKLVPEPLAEDLRIEAMSCEVSEELHRLFEQGELLHHASQLQYMDLRQRMRRIFVGGKMITDEAHIVWRSDMLLGFVEEEK